jgi:hypothetical protein
MTEIHGDPAREIIESALAPNLSRWVSGDVANRILEALLSRGYAIVPIAATGPMLDAGAQFVPDHDRADFAFGVACSDVAEIWTAMIEASAASVAPAKDT